MSQQNITRYCCDNCKREVFSTDQPTGWSEIAFQTQTQVIFEKADVCDSCSQAFIGTMNKRKQIESGRFKERKLPVHNAPHPMNADSFPFTSRADAEEN